MMPSSVPLSTGADRLHKNCGAGESPGRCENPTIQCCLEGAWKDVPMETKHPHLFSVPEPIQVVAAR